MKTILYFQSSLAASNMRELEGVRKYAADEGWKVQVIAPYPACVPGGSRKTARLTHAILPRLLRELPQRVCFSCVEFRSL